MSHKISGLKFVYLLICLAVLLGACNNPTPTQNPPIDAACNEQSLIEALEKADNDSGPDVINLYPNCIYILKQVKHTNAFNGQYHHSGLPHIESEITINGNNAEIDIQIDPGDPFIGHFLVKSNGDLELYDLTLKNGARFAGGAVIVLGGELLASNTNFLNNLAYSEGGNTVGRGGAIYNDSGTIRIIDNSLFQGNLAGYATLPDNHLGGAIYNKNGDLTVYSSTFMMNSSEGKGGAIYTEKDTANLSGGYIFIEDTYFAGNEASRKGGAIALVNESNGATFITDSKFSANTAAFGGAIFSEGSELRADFDTFVFNSADYGGAIYIKRSGVGNPSSLSSEESIYEENMVRDLGIGGAIFSENSDLFLDGSEFIRNTASSCGAIRIGGHSYLEGETWEPGAELSTDLYIPADIEINGSSFLNNWAWLFHGGAICHLQGELSIQDSEFSDNEAEEYGGALLVVDKSEFSGVLLSNNNALLGGAAAIGYPSEIVQIPGESDFVDPANLNFNTQIINSNIVDNRAYTKGGGLYVNVRGRVSISKSTFKHNGLYYNGGGIYQAAGDLAITNSTFSANYASDGAGLYNNGCSPTHPTLNIKHSTFAHNLGGGLVYRGDVNIQNSLVILNSLHDCNYNQCGSNNFSVSGSVDSDGSCAFPVTETEPKIGPLSYNGGPTHTHPLLHDSPLIDIAPDCANLMDDQRGVSRPQPYAPFGCDPGSFELDPSDPPTLPQMEPSPTTDPDDSSDNCPPFDDLEISVVLLNVPADTLVLPLYFKFFAGVPGQDEAEPWKFRATLGDPGEIESYKCDQQGFEDRLYCMFNLPPDVPGLALDLLLYKDDCEDPSYALPKVTIPEPKGSIPDSIPDPKLQCSKDLNKDACEAAGGEMSTGGSEAPHCICP